MQDQAKEVGRGIPLTFWLTHIGIGLALGVFIATVPMLGPLLIVPWLLIVVVTTAQDGTHGKTFSIQFLTIATVVVAAVFAPVKTTDRILARTLLLPATRLKLAEMDEQHRIEHDSTWLPRFIRIDTTPEIEGQLIEFPARELTVHEFIDAIESQSTLRRRFHSCGNGYTVLCGEDCSFGLSIGIPR